MTAAQRDEIEPNEAAADVSGHAVVKGDPETELETGCLIFSDYYTTREQHWAVVGGIGCGAVLGVLARDRLGLWFAATLAESGAAGRAGVVVKHILPNIIGCFVMGIVIAVRPKLQPPHPTIYAGLTTGFCGCCTTFSSYNTAVAMLFLRSADAGEGLLCAAMAIFLGAATSWVSLMLGLMLPPQPSLHVVEQAKSAQKRLSGLLASPGKTEDDFKAIASDLMAAAEELQLDAPGFASEVPQFPGKFIRLKIVVYWSSLVIALGIVIVLINIDIDHLSPLLVAAAVAPLGAWLRYGLGKWNATYTLPYFTLLVNVLAAAASAVLAYFLETSCGTHALKDVRWTAICSGASTGFCGSLSTVSSFVDEVRRLGEQNKRKAALYVALTLLGGQIVALLILGPSLASTDGCSPW